MSVWAANSLTGGATGALDRIDGNLLSSTAGTEIAVVIDATGPSFYVVNPTSGASESSPDIISPDSNAGDKRWIRVYPLGVVKESTYNANTVLAATSDNTPVAVEIAEQTLLGRITSGNIAGLTVTQVRTLLNVANGADVTDAIRTWTTAQTFKETKDTVYTITDGAAFEIDPSNGNLQVVTLGANRTPAATNFEAGQVVLLGIDDGTAYAVTWTTVSPTWVKPGGTGAAPTLATTGYTWVLLWKVSTTIYAAEVGKP